MRLPEEESGKKLKLSKLWHGPYRIIEKGGPDVKVAPVHFPGRWPDQSGCVEDLSLAPNVACWILLE